MYETYKDRVEFYIVYIREAHAADSSWAMNFTGRDGELIYDPISEDERAKVASQCVADLNLPMPALIDRLDDEVNQSYLGWPDRLYLVDTAGKVAYAGGRGPFFFSVSELVTAIDRTLAKGAGASDAAPQRGRSRKGR